MSLKVVVCYISPPFLETKTDAESDFGTMEYCALVDLSKSVMNPEMQRRTTLDRAMSLLQEDQYYSKQNTFRDV